MPYLTQSFPFTFDIVLQVGIQGNVCCYGDMTVYMIAYSREYDHTHYCLYFKYEGMSVRDVVHY